METHDNDPTTDQSTDPWNTFHDRFGSLADQVKDTYKKVAEEGGPTADDVRNALGTLADAWGQVADSVSEALQDPDVRTKIKDAASSFASAMGTTISGLGEELRRNSDANEEE